MVSLMRMLSDLLFGSKGPDSFDFFESEIDGDFHGWSGKTLFALANGQIWQQASQGLTRHYANSPKVVIYRSGTSVKMHVEGVRDTIAIKRIK